jgi:NtrC-family two-component system sensor histidine kinase KinB
MDTLPSSTIPSKSRWEKHYNALLQLVPLIMGALLGFILITNIPSGNLVSSYLVVVIIYTILTSFALYFSVWLSQGVLSTAHAIGMTAFLSLPAEATGVALFGVAAGAFIGSVILLTQKNQRIGTHLQDTITTLLMMTSRITVSFFIAGTLYTSFNGNLPLNTELWHGDSRNIIALLAYVLTYFILYTTIYILELYINRLPVRQILRDNRVLITAVLVIPVPFAIVSAELSSGITQPSEILSLTGLALIILGLHAVSRSDQQMRRQLDEMITLSVVTRATRSHLEIHGLLKTIYVQISTLFDVGDFTLLVYENEKPSHSLIIRDTQERENTNLTNLNDYALLHHVIAKRLPLFLKDNASRQIHSYDIQLLDDFPFHAWLGVPLTVGTGGYGVMSVALRSRKRSFTPSDIRLFTIVADSVCIAIENASLFERQAERVAQLSTLNNISAMLSGTLSPDTVLDSVVSSASTISEAQAVALYIYMEDDNESHPPSLVRALGLSDAFSDQAPAPLCVDGEPLYTKIILPIENVQKDDRAKTFRELLEHDYLQSFIEIPLVIGEKPIGVLTLFYDSPQIFTGEGLELFRAFGTQAAQAINNAHTYATTDEAFQRSVEQLLALAGIGRLLTSTIDLNAICELVIQQVMEATHASAGVVLLIEGEEDSRVMIHKTIETDVLMDIGAIDSGITRRALQIGQVERIDDVYRESWFDENPRLLATTRAQLAVPILRGRDVLGVISIESSRIGGFSQEDSHFVAQIANQAVIAIDNARLFHRITEARDRLQVILDTMEEAIVLINSKGKIALVNPRISLLDLLPSQLLDRPVIDVIQDKTINISTRLGFNSSADLEQLVSDIGIENAWPEHPPHLYILPTEEGGRRYLQRFIIPVLDEAMQTMGVLLVFYDQTHTQEVIRTREELTRMIVHDLRSPLTAVMTGLKLLNDYVPPTNDAYKLVQSTTQSSRQAVKKLLSRVDSLLDIAKMESGRLAVERGQVDFRAVVNTVRDELKPLAQELDIRIEDELSQEVPTLNIDRDKVERLLLNLLDNALKYSPTENIVKVSAYAPGTHGAPENFIRVDVADFGPGVPDDYKQSLFDSFVQVEGRQRVRRGVGLGLSFCKMVAEAHGGTIWIEDNKPNGTIFAFTLPIDTPMHLSHVDIPEVHQG